MCTCYQSITAMLRINRNHVMAAGHPAIFSCHLYTWRVRAVDLRSSFRGCGRLAETYALLWRIQFQAQGFCCTPIRVHCPPGSTRTDHVNAACSLYDALFTMQVVRWFFECVKEFSNEDRGKLLRFTTGSSTVPVEGFKVSASFILQNFALRIYVSRLNVLLFLQALQSHDSKLCWFALKSIPRAKNPFPIAHTCFNRSVWLTCLGSLFSFHFWNIAPVL